MNSTLIVDASPVIVLIKSDLHHLLLKLFERVIITDAVRREILAGPRNDPARSLLPAISWLTIEFDIERDDRIVPFDLGAGETETLSVALRTSNSRVLIDDAAARSCASKLGIPFIGTAGLLALATRRGYISSLESAIESVRQSGLWLSDGLVETILTKAGEFSGKGSS